MTARKGNRYFTPTEFSVEACIRSSFAAYIRSLGVTVINA